MRNLAVFWAVLSMLAIFAAFALPITSADVIPSHDPGHDALTADLSQDGIWTIRDESTQTACAECEPGGQDQAFDRHAVECDDFGQEYLGESGAVRDRNEHAYLEPALAYESSQHSCRMEDGVTAANRMIFGPNRLSRYGERSR